MKKLRQALRTLLTKLKSALVASISRHDNLVLLVVLLVALTVILSATAVLLLRPVRYADIDLDKHIASQDENQIRHPLTGTVLTSSLKQLPQVYAVMIENSADAWPLSGIEDAFLVIEAPVEADIPRFAAFFANDMEVDKIGPVRSARPYYVDWNDELAGLYAHVGGSPEALDLIAEYDTLDLNEFSQGEYFWRDTARRAAPHNVYTSTEFLNESLQELKPGLPSYKNWLFKADAPLDIDPLSLTIDWGQGELYDITWAYQSDSNQYQRMQGDEVVTSQDGDTVLANNVVVMATNITVIDSVGRRQIETVGEGDALVVQDGRIILGRWKKPTRTDRLRFYNAYGEEIAMNAGKTWIEVVPSLDRAETVTNLP